MIYLMELARKLPGGTQLVLRSLRGHVLETSAFALLTREREKRDIWADGKVDQMDVDGDVLTVFVYF